MQKSTAELPSATTSHLPELTEAMLRRIKSIVDQAASYDQAELAAMIYTLLVNEKWELAMSLIAKADTVDANAPPPEGLHKGKTILWGLLFKKQWELAKTVVEKAERVNANASPIEGPFRRTTVLWVALAKQQWDLAKAIVAKAERVDATAAPVEGPYRGKTVLWLALAWQQWDLGKAIVEKAERVDADAAPIEGSHRAKTVLWYALAKQQWDLAKAILTKAERVDANASPVEGPERQATVLWVALSWQQWDLAKAIVAKAERVDATASSVTLRGKTILEFALEHKQWELAKQIILRDRNFNIHATHEASSILKLIVVANQSELLQIAMQKGAIAFGDFISLVNSNVNVGPLQIIFQHFEKAFKLASDHELHTLLNLLKENPWLITVKKPNGNTLLHELFNSISSLNKMIQFSLLANESFLQLVEILKPNANSKNLLGISPCAYDLDSSLREKLFPKSDYQKILEATLFLPDVYVLVSDVLKGIKGLPANASIELKGFSHFQNNEEQPFVSKITGTDELMSALLNEINGVLSFAGQDEEFMLTEDRMTQIEILSHISEEFMVRQKSYGLIPTLLLSDQEQKTLENLLINLRQILKFEMKKKCESEQVAKKLSKRGEQAKTDVAVLPSSTQAGFFRKRPAVSVVTDNGADDQEKSTDIDSTQSNGKKQKVDQEPMVMAATSSQ